MAPHHCKRRLSSIPMVGFLLMILLACAGPPNAIQSRNDCPPLPTPLPANQHHPFTGRITFTASCSYGGGIDIFLLNVADESIINLTNHPADDLEVSWSPDGNRLAFASNRAGNYDIYVMDANGSHVLRLTDNPSDDRFPSWSPDGQQIGFVSYRDSNPVDERGEMYVMKPDGTGQRRITNNAVMQADQKWVPWLAHSLGSWSPDGQQFVTHIDHDLYILYLDGRPPLNITKHPAKDQKPQWSPDGQHILFLSNRDGSQYDWAIYVLDLKTANVNRLTDLTNDQPRWSPTGQLILFTDNASGNAELYVINKDGTNKINLTKNASDDFEGEWSPDGEYISFFTIREGYKLYVMKADGTQQIGYLPVTDWHRHVHVWKPQSRP